MDYKLLGIAVVSIFLYGLGCVVAMWVMLTWPVAIFYALAGAFVWFFVWMKYKDLLFKKKMKESNERWEELCRGRKPRMPAK